MLFSKTFQLAGALALAGLPFSSATPVQRDLNTRQTGICSTDAQCGEGEYCFVFALSAPMGHCRPRSKAKRSTYSCDDCAEGELCIPDPPALGLPTYTCRSLPALKARDLEARQSYECECAEGELCVPSGPPAAGLMTWECRSLPVLKQRDLEARQESPCGSCQTNELCLDMGVSGQPDYQCVQDPAPLPRAF